MATVMGHGVAGQLGKVPDLHLKITFLLLVPLCMALILGWNGVGMLKPWPARSVGLLYWTLVTPGIWLFTYAIQTAGRRIIDEPVTGQRFVLLSVASAVISLNLYRPINSYFAFGFARVFGLSNERVAPPFPTDLSNFIDWQLAYLAFVALWVLATLVANRLSSDRFLSGERTVEMQTGGSRAAASLREYLDRLEEGALISASAEDHYVRVHSLNGNARFHGRFAQALELLERCDGMRVHRSHWAARSHMRGYEGGSGRASLQLSDGRRLPVSAAYRDAVLLAVASAETTAQK